MNAENVSSLKIKANFNMNMINAIIINDPGPQNKS